MAALAAVAMTLDEALARNAQLREALLKAASDGAVLVEAVPQDDPPDQVDQQTFALLMQPKRKARR
jgi:hypothetical protein